MFPASYIHAVFTADILGSWQGTNGVVQYVVFETHCIKCSQNTVMMVIKAKTSLIRT